MCIIGRSNIVGMPLSLLLTKHDCCVNVCHSKTPLEEMIRQVGEAEILITCCGQPQLIKSSWLKKGTIAIDVGITYMEENGENLILGDIELTRRH